MKQHLSFDCLIDVSPGNSTTYLNQLQQLHEVSITLHAILVHASVWEESSLGCSRQVYCTIRKWQRGADHPELWPAPKQQRVYSDGRACHQAPDRPSALCPGHRDRDHRKGPCPVFSTSLAVPRGKHTGKRIMDKNHAMETEMMCNYQLTAMAKIVGRVDSCRRNNTWALQELHWRKKIVLR